MKKLSLLVPLFGLLFASSAHANSTYNGYVCESHYNPASTTYGKHGLLVFQLYTEAGCNGTFLGSFVVCSSGATSASCDLGFLHTENQILALWQQVTTAMQHSFVTQVLGDSNSSKSSAVSFSLR